MSIFWRPIIKQIKLCFVLAMVFTVFFCPGSGHAQKKIYWGSSKKTVVIDPGHGGHDHGAKGPDNNLEKTIVLRLAQMIKDQLKEDHKVILTRTDDYWLKISERTNVANHAKADVFISIHTGGSSLHQAGGINIYRFKEISIKSDDPVAPNSIRSLDPDSMEITWNEIQSRHLSSSERLAKTIKLRISDQVHFSTCKIQAAPLLILRGADMPAILIEIGYLTNPNEEKALQDSETLAKFVTAIRQGIDDFFEMDQE